MAFDPGTFCFRSELAKRSTTRADKSIEHLKIDRFLSECVIRIYSVPRGRYSKMFDVHYIKLTVYSQQTSLLVQQINETNVICQKYKIILLHLPRATG